MLALHLAELRQGGPQAQLGRVGRVDAPHERLHQPLQGLAAQPALDERRQALVGVVVLAGEDQVHQHPELAAPREDRGRQDRAEPVGGHQHEPFGDRHEPPLADDERATMLGVGPDQALAQAQASAEVDPPGLVRDERVGPPLQGEAVAPAGPDRAAEAVLGLEHDHLDRPSGGRRALDEPVRRGQAGQAAADHHHPILARRTLGQRDNSPVPDPNQSMPRFLRRPASRGRRAEVLRSLLIPGRPPMADRGSRPGPGRPGPG